ncbi:MAG TPA: VapC toxin family PIN domain ribonuclease [Opitutae bacterium]|nr:VapC toxin family PIN domain ribonuclease [Opitutae bacterium]
MIVDASVVLAVILDEPEKAALVVETEGATLLAPSCLSWEIGNAFSAILKRKRMDFESVSQGLKIFEMIPIQEMEITLVDALELCNRHDIYAYDAYYLQLAKRSSLPLLTLDRRMMEVAQLEKIQVKGIK